jgi:hypothetical protein
VHGEHLIRARDVNLAAPVQLTYPVFDETGEAFQNEFYTVDSFSTWQTHASGECAFPPCLEPLARPIPELGAVNVFESAASSTYHGMTISARRRMTGGFYFRLAYTLARATDDGQDALVAGRPATVQNSFAPSAERGPSVTDQRHRFAFSWIYEPRFFHREHRLLGGLFNDWRVSGVVTVGSGRPVNARTVGDANRDGNSLNDRLPGWQRNAFTGPDYATTDLRLARKIYPGERIKLEFLAEAFNVMNRANRRVEITDDGFVGSAGDFVPQDRTVAGKQYPAHFRVSSGFLVPTNAYASRQVQFALRMTF